MKVYFSVAEVKEYSDIKIFYKIFKKHTKAEVKIEWEDEPLKTEVSNISSLQEMTIKNENIEYFSFDIYNERKKSRIYNKDGILLPREQRTNKIESSGIVFKYNNIIKIIFQCGIDNITKFRLDLFNKYTILEEKIYFDEDILFWLFWHFEQKREEELLLEKELYINDLKTYTGVSQDNKNEIKIDGEKTSALLATLGSIFSSKKFKLLNIEFDYLKENTIVEIRNSGTYKVDLNCSSGDCDAFAEIERTIFLLIYIELFLFPTIKEAYKHAVENHIWDEMVQLTFTKELGEKIIVLVKEGLNIVEERLKTKNEENKYRLFSERITK